MPAVLIATYNLKNLFLHGEGPAKSQQEVRPLARMIAQVGADVIVLQEVGSRESLMTLNERLSQPYPYLGFEPGNSDRSIHLGVLSRLPVELHTHRDRVLQDESGNPMQQYASEAAAKASECVPLRLFRDVLRVDVAGLQHPLSIFAVHLKSRTNKSWQLHPADVIRAAECRMLCAIVEEFQCRYPQHLVAIAGDFNDRLVGDALAPLHALGLRDPLGEVLRRSGRNPSTYWSKRRMRIDHILIAPNTGAFVVADSAQIHTSRMAQTASDHYPVSLRLALTPE